MTGRTGGNPGRHYMKDAGVAPFADRPDRACVNVDTDLFYTADPMSVEAARCYCRRCPVSSECAAWGIAHEQHGVWGGLTPQERITARWRRTRDANRVLAHQAAGGVA